MGISNHKHAKYYPATTKLMYLNRASTGMKVVWKRMEHCASKFRFDRSVCPATNGKFGVGFLGFRGLGFRGLGHCGTK